MRALSVYGALHSLDGVKCEKRNVVCPLSAILHFFLASTKTLRSIDENDPNNFLKVLTQRDEVWSIM